MLDKIRTFHILEPNSAETLGFLMVHDSDGVAKDVVEIIVGEMLDSERWEWDVVNDRDEFMVDLVYKVQGASYECQQVNFEII